MNKFLRKLRISLWLLKQAGLNIINSNRIKGLKDAYMGQRAFVIGNGPSLTIADLNMLKHEKTFACNKIYLAYEQTDWRPTFYAANDPLMFESSLPMIQQSGAKISFFPNHAKDKIRRSRRVVFLNFMGSDRYPEIPGFSSNCSEGVYEGFTVTYTNLQLAYYMGFSEVYLLGVDWNYVYPKKVVYDSKVRCSRYISGGERNHFHPDYLREGESMWDPNMERHRLAYIAARNAFDAAGRKLYNATRGGALDVIRRISLEDALLNDVRRQSERQ